MLEQHDTKEPPAKKLRRPALESISKTIEGRYEVNPADLRSSSKTRALTLARRVFSIIASGQGYKAVEIGHYLEKGPTIVTFSLRNKETVAEEVKAVKRAVDNITTLQA